MPWCPKCRFEYLPQLLTCPECKVRLVAERPEEVEEGPAHGKGKEFEQVLLGTVVGEMHAALIRNALREARIPSRQQIRPGLMLGTPYDSAMASAAAVFSIYVNRRDLKRAVEVWREYEERGE